ncbi:ABC transporter substrate-binding protein [Jannaschia marina]|uniref:ABC transporter substrate-binding protein n=1 Tax=Jannaschia marina TaxID=2741674 RepID=UPI0015CD25BD|nr:ABC transporter substrate-binding protein [Jannaschia marina]
MLRKALAIGALALAATGALADSHATPKPGGTLITTLPQTPRHLNPAVQSGIVTGAPGAQLFATPLRYDENFEPQPYLAESWEFSEDGLSMTLTLRDNAVFHDGEPIESHDVAFSIRAIQDNHPFKTMFAPVAEVDTSDPKVVVMTLDRPHPALLLAMSSQLMSIIPEHIYGDGQDLASHPRNSQDVVGSGPFKFVEFTPDQHVILDRFDDFFMGDGRPYLDRIVFRIIKDASARTIGLENGELHLSTFENTVNNITRMMENSDLVVTDEGYAAIGAINWLAFNTQSDGPTSDPKVRQAIAYAVDRDFILNAIMQGVSQPALTGIHPGSPFYDASVEPYDLDLEKAAALLDEAGYPAGDNGTRFSLSIDYGNPTTRPQAEFTKASLARVGIDVTVNSLVDFPTWAQKISNHEFDMTWDTVFNWGDPVIGVHRTYSSDNIKPGVIWSNTQQYVNPRIDELMEAAGQELDLDARKALYAEFQQILSEDLPVYWTNTLPYHTISQQSVMNPPRGIWASSAPYDQVWLDEE